MHRPSMASMLDLSSRHLSFSKFSRSLALARCALLQQHPHGRLGGGGSARHFFHARTHSACTHYATTNKQLYQKLSIKNTKIDRNDLRRCAIRSFSCGLVEAQLRRRGHPKNQEKMESRALRTEPAGGVCTRTQTSSWHVNTGTKITMTASGFGQTALRRHGIVLSSLF